jgi:hypothetical protein
MSNEGWREERDEDGFPIPNEDRDGALYLDPEYLVVYYCTFVEGLGWCWKTLGRLI